MFRVSMPSAQDVKYSKFFVSRPAKMYHCRGMTKVSRKFVTPLFVVPVLL